MTHWIRRSDGTHHATIDGYDVGIRQRGDASEIVVALGWKPVGRATLKGVTLARAKETAEAMVWAAAALRQSGPRHNPEPSFTPPADVRAAAREGLQLHARYNRGGTSVGLASARWLASGRALPLWKVRHVARYFPRHAGDRLDLKDPPSNGWIAWLLWGGTPGRRWAESIVAKHVAA